MLAIHQMHGMSTLAVETSTTAIRHIAVMLGVLEPDSNPAYAGYFDT